MIEQVWLVGAVAFLAGILVHKAVSNSRAVQERSHDEMKRLAERPVAPGGIGQHLLRQGPEHESLVDECKRLLVAGKKIEALKLYRERSGLGLKEAKDVIDCIDQGKYEMLRARSSEDRTEEVITQCKQLLRHGHKIEALKLYRQSMGVGLKEAKDVIDQLDVSM